MMISLTKIIGFLEKFHRLIKTECITNAFIKADNPTLYHEDQQTPFRMTNQQLQTPLSAHQPYKALQSVTAYEEDTAAWC